MASPDALKLEQKARALKLKEEALSRQAQTQLRTETRLSSTQHEVAQKERANRLKMHELNTREQKLDEDQRLIEQEMQSLATRQAELEAKKKSTNYILVPLLLIVCIVGGYLAFDYMNQQQRQFSQIALASKNIDKLANRLNITQNQVIEKSSALNAKKAELDKTKTMLVNLSATSDQLKAEITKLVDPQLVTSSDKSALTNSAETLASQLLNLKTQLEDNYLTIDINEAFIDYQEHDLKVFKQALDAYQQKLTQKEGSINEHQAQQVQLENLLATSKMQINRLSNQLKDVNNRLELAESKLKNTVKANQELEKENIGLLTELNKLKEVK